MTNLKVFWYRNELSEICRKYGMGLDGTKTELEANIKNRLSWTSGVVMSKRPKFEFNDEITLETKLLVLGLKFNEQTRKFFATYLIHACEVRIRHLGKKSTLYANGRTSISVE